MPENDFWKGLVTGALVGMVFAAYAKGDFDRLFRKPSPALEDDQMLDDQTLT